MVLAACVPKWKEEGRRGGDRRGRSRAGKTNGWNQGLCRVCEREREKTRSEG